MPKKENAIPRGADATGLPFRRAHGIGNAAPREFGNSGANSVGDLFIVELSRYQA
jgi:hypothetical protein